MTISQLVATSGAQMRVFDMGRRISKIGRKEFEAFEELARPYPSPYLRHAWLGILSWNPKQAGQHNIWFLKLPLDEQNILQPGPRDAFLQHWLRVVANPDQEHGEAPCSFKPDASRMAYFHALALRLLGQPTTQYYATARAYLSGDNDFSQWQHLGLQGLAEVVARIDEDHNQELIASAMTSMPAVPRNALLGFLENAEAGPQLTNALNDALAQVMAEIPQAADLAAFARALSASVSVDQRQQLLDLMMLHPAARDVEVISALGSRCWQDLEGRRLHNYLELLAALGDQVFSALIADLMTLPGMRGRILEAFRNPQRSDQLSTAIGHLMAAARGQMQ
ncbi:MAG TPA: DUF3549 domain-containing protein [Oceanospirillales bacterium]|nr:hypothetical protein [Oceanospirillaceae bacterium]HBS42754.1 DUF3549 domain-containing protein [Oceanospirillales bacterium]|tara:strand:+ start:604 stop:1614 length:1011 start_codon:yes stop_codon:yes gene_type:complete